MDSVATRVIASWIIVVGMSLPWSSARAQSRVALVIGNSAYRHVAPLANPTNDASDIAASLTRLGFAVARTENAGFDTMRRALLDFGRKARDAELAVVYFAGHGMEVGGENWLIPIDAELKSDIDAEQEAIGLKSVMLSVSGAAKLGLVMLDACRNNPFAARMRRTVRVRAVERGLARVEPVSSVLVAYASRDGTTAADGSARNSPFTSALLRHLETPGLEINFLFRNVRDDVMIATGRAQEPYVYGSLSKEAIYLKAGLPLGPPAISQPPPAPSQPPPTPTVTAPREPLPPEIPVDPEIIRVVESHPFFADAPPVRVTAYATQAIANFVVNATPTTTSSDYDTTLRWLRRGFVRYDSTNQAATSHRSCVPACRTSARTVSLSAANGLIGLGWKSVSTSSFPGSKPTTSTYTSTLVRLGKLEGRIYPVQLGNRFSYEVVSRTNSTGSDDESTSEYSCEVSKRYEARSFHSSLSGAAYLLSCDYRIVYRQMKAANSNGQSNDIFFEGLGVWISADPTSPKERLLSKDGTTTLKSFTMVR